MSRGPFLGELALWFLLHLLHPPRLQSCLLVQTRGLGKSGRGVIALDLEVLMLGKEGPRSRVRVEEL